MERTLITNARMVSDGRVVEGDLLIEGERIARIGGTISAPPPVRVVDAAGRYLLPGMIDDQVHFREPGLTHKGDIASESAAAVAGGITSYMEMPNVSPPTTTREALAAKYELAAGRSYANHAFYFGATNNNIDEIRALTPDDACGIKVFMGASTGNLLVDDRRALNDIFAEAPLLVVTHCEDTPMIQANEASARQRHGEAVPMREHGEIRSAEACLASSTLAVGLARQHDARLHVLHLTTAVEMALFSAKPRADKRITAEVCVHHLWFDDSRYDELGTRIKCNPAIKTAADRQALHEALADGRIDIIATDHAPHTADEKADPNYFKAPAGLPLVQHVLVTLLEFVHDGRYPIEFIVDRCAHAPADVFGVRERGYLREGYFADLVLVDMAAPWTVSAANVLYKCGWSPFEGTTFRSGIVETFVNGRSMWRGGAVAGTPAGQRLIVDAAR